MNPRQFSIVMLIVNLVSEHNYSSTNGSAFSGDPLKSGGEDFGGGKEEQGGSCEKQMLHHSKKEELLEADELLKYNQVRLDKLLYKGG